MITSSGTIQFNSRSSDNLCRVISLSYDRINFTNGYSLESYHYQDCCESHELYIKDLTLKDFDDLIFNFDNDDFFKRIDGYGIELIPIRGHSVKIAGHGYNNGYYSTDLILILNKDNKEVKRYDISECQDLEIK